MPQFRKICAVRARTMMTGGGDGKHVEDSIGMVADWRRAGLIWEVPYSALVPQEGPDNVLYVGRCIGATGDAWEVMRVIPAAALTGQAAGLAAALSLRNGSMPSDLNYEILAKALRLLSVPLHFDELEIDRP